MVLVFTEHMEYLNQMVFMANAFRCHVANINMFLLSWKRLKNSMWINCWFENQETLGSSYISSSCQMWDIGQVTWSL